MSVLCPICKNVELESIDIDGVIVDCCETCEGIYYDKSELKKVIENTFEDNAEVLQKFLDVLKSTKKPEEITKKCPKDGSEMYSVEYPENSGIIIDVCPKCEGVWTDKDETQKILKQFLKIEAETIPENVSNIDSGKEKHWSAKAVKSFVSLFR